MGSWPRDKDGRGLRDFRVAGGLDLTRFGHRGVRIFGGRMGSVSIGTATTYQVTGETQAPFDAVSLVLANTNTTTSLAIVAVAAAALPSAADLNGSTATWVTGKMGGQNRGMIPIAKGAGRTAYYVTDPIRVSALDRTDDGDKPLVALRAYMASSSVLSVVGNGTDDFTTWADRTDGHLWAMRSQAVDGVGTPANFTSTTNQSQSPIVGIVYWSRGRVANFAGFGDSNTDGRDPDELGAGFGLIAADDLATPELPIEWSNFGRSGVSSPVFYSIAMDVLDHPLLRPEIAVLPSFSPNDPGASPITQAMATRASAMRSKVVSRAYDKGTMPVLWTCLPQSVYDWGATDSIRRDLNAALLADRGLAPVADFAAIVDGTIDGDGQMQPKPGSLPDGIHPFRPVNEQLAAALAAELRASGGLR